MYGFRFKVGILPIFSLSPTREGKSSKKLHHHTFESGEPYSDQFVALQPYIGVKELQQWL
jgi:hypothetical protein